MTTQFLHNFLLKEIVFKAFFMPLHKNGIYLVNNVLNSLDSKIKIAKYDFEVYYAK